MAKDSVLYINSKKPGDWTIAAKGSKLYELIQEKAEPDKIRACYLEANDAFNLIYSEEFILKYYKEVPK